MAAAHQAAERGVTRITSYLDAQGVQYGLVEHEPTYSAVAEARAAHEHAACTAKTIVLADGDQFRLAVIPADQRLDLAKARELLDTGPELRMASETEIAAAFPAYDVGAMPPVGPALPQPALVDVRLLYSDTVLCCGGDHTHGLVMDTRDMLALCEPRVGDLCAGTEPPRRRRFARTP